MITQQTTIGLKRRMRGDEEVVHPPIILLNVKVDITPTWFASSHYSVPSTKQKEGTYAVMTLKR